MKNVMVKSTRTKLALALPLLGLCLLIAGRASPAGETGNRRAMRVKDEAKFQAETLPLLGRWTADNIRQLSLVVPNLPPEMAGAALWRLATVPDGVNASVVYTSALRSSEPIIRMTAADIIVARGLEEELRFIYPFLQTEEDPEVAKHVTLAVARSKSKSAAIDGLVKIVNQLGVQDAAADAAFSELKRLTGASLSNDPAEWRDWWANNSNSQMFR